MRFAVIGFDDHVRRLAQAAASDGCELVAAFDVTEDAREQLALAGSVDPDWKSVSDWEILLAGNLAEAVLVGPGDWERRAEQLRKLVQAAVPVLAVQPLCEAIVGYEVDMIRQDSGGILAPYLPLALHPAVGQLAEWIMAGEDGPLGKCEQLVMERRWPQRDDASILRQFAQDVELLRSVTGEIDKVNAMGAADSSLANVTVSLLGPAGIVTRWSVQPAEFASQETSSGAFPATLTLLGTRDRARLQIAADDTAWVLETGGRRETFEDADVARTGWRRFVETMGGQGALPTWASSCRGLELAETIPRSLKRGRTIQLYNEEYTESNSFKGVMAIGGCGLILLAFFVLLMFAIYEGFALPYRDYEPPALGDNGQPIDSQVETSRWPLALRLWPVYPLAIFLGLQLLQLFIRPPKPPVSTTPTAS